MRANGWLNASKRDGACPLCDHLDWCSFTEDKLAVLCRRTEIAPPGWERTKAAKDGVGFVFVVKQNSTQQDLEQWQREREAQRKQREQDEKAKRAKSLSLVERDRQFRKLLDQLSLSAEDNADLQRRGLTDEQIKLGGFKSVEVWQKLDWVLDHRLPGVNLDGRSLNIKPGDEGYLSPIKNADGLIIGCQLRRRAQDDSGRYRWLTSATRKRPNGATSHLPNGELPITVQRPTQLKSKAIGLVEGTGVKPFVTAQRQGQVVIGAASANFAGSKEQFKETLNKLSTELDSKEVILYADGGAIANPHVMQQYRTSYKLATKLGFHVLVGWWDQFTKDDPDIDELPADAQVELITFAQFEGLLHREKRELEQLSAFIKETYNKVAHKFWKRTGELPPKPQPNPQPKPVKTDAIVLLSQWQQWLNAQSPVIPYKPGFLPTEEEYQQLGCPKIEFTGGDRNLLIKEIYQKWDKSLILESSDTGQGKSHSAGELTSDYLTGGKGRVFINDPNHRNPTTPSVEQNFTDQPPRHNGLAHDHERKTALGYPHVVRPKNGQTPDIKGNCPETETFLLLNQDKNLIVYGGKGSPICEKCPQYKDAEGKVKCNFILERQAILNEEKEIRQHLAQSVPGRGVALNESDENKKPVDVFIVEETGASLNPYKNVPVTKKDFAHAYQELKQKDSKLAEVVEPLHDAIYELFNVEEMPEYGFDYVDARQHLLPTIPKIYQRFNDILWDRWLKDGWEDNTPKTSPWTFLIDTISKTLYPNLGAMLNSRQTPIQKQAIIRNNVPLNWISLALGAIMENQAHLRVDQLGLHITKYDWRYRSTMTSYKLVLMMDSTITRDELAVLTKFKKSDILEIRQVKPDYSNYNFTIINGIGSCSKKRRAKSDFDVQVRIEKTVGKIHDSHKIIGVIDHQLFANNYWGYEEADTEIKPGYWGRDNRNSNEFMRCKALTLIGTPLPNLGQAAAEYHALTGSVVRPIDLFGGYGHYVRSRAKAETYQAIGRSRAHLKPEPTHIYLIGNDAVTANNLIQRYPGCTVNEVEIYDFCSEAAPKGVQRERGLVEELIKAIKGNTSTGSKEIAAQLGVSDSRVRQIGSEIFKNSGIKGGFGQLKTALVLLIESFKAKLTPLDELPEDARWVAEKYLPLIVEEDLSEAMETLKALGKGFGWKTYKQILAATDTTTVCKLLGRLLAVVVPSLDIHLPEEKPG